MLTLTRNRVSVSGNITLGAGAHLTLDATTLYMESNRATITLAPGAVLTLTGGSSVNDPTNDVDDGSAADFAYTINAGPGATVEVK